MPDGDVVIRRSVGDVLQVDLVAREHRVLLSRYAVDILRESEQLRPVPAAHEPVFTSVRGKQIDGSSISKLVSELGVAAVSGVACTGARARPVESGRSPFGLGDSRARELADPHQELLNAPERGLHLLRHPLAVAFPQALPPPAPAPRAVSRRGAVGDPLPGPGRPPREPGSPPATMPARSSSLPSAARAALSSSASPLFNSANMFLCTSGAPSDARHGPSQRDPAATPSPKKKNPLPPGGFSGERGQGRVANAAAERYRRRYRRYPPTAKRPPSRNCAMIGRAGTAASQR